MQQGNGPNPKIDLLVLDFNSKACRVRTWDFLNWKDGSVIPSFSIVCGKVNNDSTFFIDQSSKGVLSVFGGDTMILANSDEITNVLTRISEPGIQAESLNFPSVRKTLLENTTVRMKVDQSHYHYQLGKDGKVKVLDSRDGSSWSTSYQMFSCGGFTFVQVANGNLLVVTNFNSNQLFAIEIDGSK